MYKIKFLILLLFISSFSEAAYKYNPFTSKPDYYETGGGGDNLGNHIATMTVTASYGIITSSVSASSITVVGVVQISSATAAGRPALSVNYSGVSNNLNKGMVDIYRNDPGATAGDTLLSVGSSLQEGQFRVRDSFPLYLGDFGARIGTVNIGLASFSDKIMSANSVNQHVNLWSSGHLIFQTASPGDGGKDIIFSPQATEAMRITSAGGVTVKSSMTVTGAGGLGVTYGVTVGSLTVNTGGLANQAVCWKTNTTLGYCSTVVAADGTCTCN